MNVNMVIDFDGSLNAGNTNGSSSIQPAENINAMQIVGDRALMAIQTAEMANNVKLTGSKHQLDSNSERSNKRHHLVVSLMDPENPWFTHMLSLFSPDEIALFESINKAWKKAIDDPDQKIWKTQCLLQRIAVNPIIKEVLGTYHSDHLFYWGKYFPELVEEDGDLCEPYRIEPSDTRFDSHILSIINDYDDVLEPRNADELIDIQRNLGSTEYYKSHFSHPKPVIAFGTKEWKSHSIRVEDEPCLHWKIHQKLREPNPFSPAFRLEQSCQLVFCPDKVWVIEDGRVRDVPTPISDFKTIVDRISGIATFFTFNSDVKWGMCEKPSQWVLINDGIISGSTNLGLKAQIALLQKYSHYRFPHPFHALTAQLIKLVQTQSYLFDNNYTVCDFREARTLDKTTGNITGGVVVGMEEDIESDNQFQTFAEGILLNSWKLPCKALPNVGVAPVLDFEKAFKKRSNANSGSALTPPENLSVNQPQQ